MKTARAALAGACILLLAGCATPSGDRLNEPTGGIRIVASIDVYGDIARTIAGDRATVTSIITGSAQDPHSYEATARDRLAVAKADIVIENGGGYDPFMHDMLSASNREKATIITVSGFAEQAGAGSHDDAPADAQGHDDLGYPPGFNEHVWYDFQVIDAFAQTLAQDLEEFDESGAATFEANLAMFEQGLGTLTEAALALRDNTAGLGVFSTEPVPDRLLAELGFVNRTPESYVSAVEVGVDVAPAVLLKALHVVESGDVALVVYNIQTTGAQIEQVVAAARKQGVPVVLVTETLPDGAHYLDWMESNLAAIDSALDGPTQ